MTILTTRRRVICWHEVSRGGIGGASIHPSDVFKAAITTNAAIVLAHNHPSGEPEPSPDDFKAMAHLAEVGAMLRLEVLDHVIIGQGAHVSLRATEREGFVVVPHELNCRAPMPGSALDSRNDLHASLATLTELFLDRVADRRQGARDRLPDDGYTDAEVLMNEQVSHVAHVLPWNGGTARTGLRVNVTRGLANHFEVANDGVDCSLVGKKDSWVCPEV